MTSQYQTRWSIYLRWVLHKENIKGTCWLWLSVVLLLSMNLVSGRCHITMMQEYLCTKLWVHIVEPQLAKINLQPLATVSP